MKQFLFCIALFSALALSAQTSYQDRATLSGDATFRGRVRFAMLEAASNILADTSASARVQYPFAGRILLEPTSEYFVSMFTNAVLTNPVISGASSDGDLAFTVNTQFVKLSRAYRRERKELTTEEEQAEALILRAARKQAQE